MHTPARRDWDWLRLNRGSGVVIRLPCENLHKTVVTGQLL